MIVSEISPDIPATGQGRKIFKEAIMATTPKKKPAPKKK